MLCEGSSDPHDALHELSLSGNQCSPCCRGSFPPPLNEPRSRHRPEEHVSIFSELSALCLDLKVQLLMGSGQVDLQKFGCGVS